MNKYNKFLEQLLSFELRPQLKNLVKNAGCLQTSFIPSSFIEKRTGKIELK